jgi:hypothetical protein
MDIRQNASRGAGSPILRKTFIASISRMFDGS